MLEKIVPLKVFLNTLRINTSQPLGKAWFHLHSHHWWGLACSGGEKRAMDIAGVTWPKPTETYKFTLVRCWKPVLFLFWSALPWVTVGSLKVITRPQKKKKKKKKNYKEKKEERAKGARCEPAVSSRPPVDRVLWGQPKLGGFLQVCTKARLTSEEFRKYTTKSSQTWQFLYILSWHWRAEQVPQHQLV